MTVLIAGGSGLLGRCLIELFDKSGIDYVSTYNTRPCKNGYKLDFNNMDTIIAFMHQHNITVCVNSIVQRLTDVCEEHWDEAKQINVDIAERIARACTTCNVHLIHISTDYVFDGRIGSAPYNEHSQVNPLNNYGMTKLIAECRVRTNTSRYTIIRVPVLYCHDCKSIDENAVTLIGKKVFNQVAATSEDDFSIRRPVYIPDFCHFIKSFVDEPKVGLYHFYNPYDCTTKYKMAQTIASILHKSADHIRPADGGNGAANRPYDTQLVDSKYNITDYKFTPLDDGIRLCFEPFIHPSIFSKDIFLLLDLDGTLVDTDRIHFEAYRNALNIHGFTLTWALFEEYINSKSIDSLFQQLGVHSELWSTIKADKRANFMNVEKIDFMPGAEQLLECCLSHDVNFAIVTNTSGAICDFIKSKCPLLAQCKAWISREDYSAAKPAGDCYQLAVERFRQTDQVIIGIENTANGCESLKSVTRIIYCICDAHSSAYKYAKNNDVFIYPSINKLLPDITHKNN